jgi:phosphatidylglycerol:prolipoprotein diacylglycerol transferase
MRPTLFSIGDSFPIHSYGALIALGMVAGLLISIRQGKRVGLDRAAVLDLVFYAIVTGLLGSRLLYVLVHAPEYASLCFGTGAPRPFLRVLSDCAAPLRIWQGGLVFLGGAILAAVVCLVYARRRKLPLGATADALAPGVALAHVFGRLGCLLVGCCYGQAHAFGLHFPPGSVAYSELLAEGHLPAGSRTTMGLFPTQILESAGELLIFLWLLRLGKRRPFSGAVGLSYGIAYAGLRFVLEIFRGDERRDYAISWAMPPIAKLLGLPPDQPLFFSSAQWFSLGILVVCGIAYARLRRASQTRA